MRIAFDLLQQLTIKFPPPLNECGVQTRHCLTIHPDTEQMVVSVFLPGPADELPFTYSFSLDAEDFERSTTDLVGDMERMLREDGKIP